MHEGGMFKGYKARIVKFFNFFNKIEASDVVGFQA